MGTLPNRRALHSATLEQLPDLWQRFHTELGDLPAIRALCLMDRFYLLTAVFRRLDLWHPWLYARCREVEAAPDGYLDLWARDHRKSTIITYAGTIQEVLKNPEITVGIFSHTQSIAQKFLWQIQRELQSNAALIDAFPDVLYRNPEREAPSWSLQSGLTVKRKTNPKEATIEAHGLVNGQPIGKHYALMVYDDVVVPESVTTPEQIEKTTEAWALSDNLSTVNGRKWHIGTRYSFADTYEEMMKRGSVKPRIYPATHDGTLAGRPVFLSEEVWKRKVKDQGDAVIACQMLQNPLEGRQAMFDVADIQVYDIRPETLAVYIMVDPASSKKKGSDNTAMAVIGVDRTMNKFLLDGFEHKMNLSERWTNLRNLVVRWRQASGVQSVRVGYERYGMQSDIEYFQERMQVEHLSFEIVELNWPHDGNGSKEDRVQRLGPDFRNHRFFVPYDNRMLPDGTRIHPSEPPRYTRNQRKMLDSNYEYRLAQPIRKRDHEGKAYDLADRLLNQVHFFPFGKKDLIDATSRIYDMEATPPVIVDQQTLEPDYV